MDMSRFELIEELGNAPYEPELTKGSKVKCVSVSEYQSNWGGNDSAKDYLIIGNVYTLSRDPEVHSWHTKYYLEEVPGKKFNSVQFVIYNERGND